MAVLVLLAFAAISYWTEARKQPPPPRPPDYTSDNGVGKRLPALELEPLTGDGKPVTLEKLAGRVAVINFWGTWCPPCRDEFPEIARLYDALRDNPGACVLAVSCGPGGEEDPKALRRETTEFVAQSGYEMPTYSDPNETTRAAFDQVAGLRVFPTTCVIDREGLIRGVWRGYSPGVTREIKGLVEELLQPAPASM